jgi:hypothetical protein
MFSTPELSVSKPVEDTVYRILQGLKMRLAI